MMSWPTWPPLSSKKFEVVFIVHRLEGEKMKVQTIMGFGNFRIYI